MTKQELEARLKALENFEIEAKLKLRTLEDIEEINKLQRAYGYYLEQWEWHQMMDLFSTGPDVSVEAGPYGVYTGQEGIKQFFAREDKPRPPEKLHVMMQISGIVDVETDGKTAKGRWY